MDVRDLNERNHVKNKLKNPMCNTKISQFSIETYFIWFSALIFATELVVDLCLATYYFHRQQTQWGWIMLAIIIVPLIMCQIYSLCLLRTDTHVQATALVCHLFLFGIPYRYHNILRKLDKDKAAKASSQDIETIKDRIRDVNSIQMLNAIFQYFPQFLFQAFLIIYRKYKCVVTGVSAGLAGFSFLWHIFVHFYFCFKCYQNNGISFDRNDLTAGTRIIDNLSTTDGGTIATGGIGRNPHSSASSIISNATTTGHNSITAIASISSGGGGAIGSHHHSSSDTLTKNLKNFEKPMYNTDDKNFVSKKNSIKNVEKNNIFGFNKRKPIYEHEDFDFTAMGSGAADTSTVFFEIDDTTMDSGKFYSSLSSNINTKDIDNFINENNVNLNLTKSFNDYKYNSREARKVLVDSDDDLKCSNLQQQQQYGVASMGANGNVMPENRNTVLKRKGICSSQEMLHLVDIMNDHISPEQVDILAKSLVELGGDESLRTESEHDDPDNTKLLLEQFPPIIDDKLLENIDAAIYENQIIFQERIRKNQLTIQNLKLQDQMLSKYMGDLKAIPCPELLSIRDYENMCFTNISRQNRGMKHWRNYLNDIDANTHDNSTVQHSSFYVNTNTLSNSLTDLYINETDNGSTVIDEIERLAPVTGLNKKSVRWQSKLIRESSAADLANCSDDCAISDELYAMVDNESGSSSVGVGCTGDGGSAGGACALPEKNILVETINKINVDSPLKNLLVSKPVSFGNSILDPCLDQYYDEDDMRTEHT